MIKSLFKGFALMACILVSSCSNNSNSFDSKIDPYKSFNKKMFSFNRIIDKNLIRPITNVYDFLIPNIIEARINTFFRNLDEIQVITNDILQAEINYAGIDSARFIINSSIGIFGLFDVASQNGIPKREQSFSVTLFKWGFRESPYIVLPLLGSSTIYDSFSFPIDSLLLSPITYIKPYSSAIEIYLVDKINIRSSLMGYDKTVDNAFDPYIFVRDAYLQKRKNQIDKILNIND